jgi:4-amino-4-deoxy-L-arabinose transferase-like glycosyltransferase
LSRSWLIFPLLLVYLFNLGAVGFLAPDEPRYASIGREMAASHDFITPRLDQKPWFEKPPLVYWMVALGRFAHLPDEWAARLPVVLTSLIFLAFFYTVLEQEFSRRVAFAATAILSTSAGWVAYSSVAVNDLPMTVALSAAMLVALFQTRRESGYLAGALLGLAILAKAFVPLVLFVPVFLIARRTRWTMILGCLVVAAPWHLLAWARNGGAFWQDYLWKQQILRFFSPSLAHVQPFWYYLPVLLAGLFPWTPLAALLIRRKTFEDVRVRFLIAWILFALVFFSVARNKLPGYVLPLLPPLAIVFAIGLDRAGTARKWWIASAALPLILLPAIIPALPDALLSGIRNTPIHWPAIAAGLPFAMLAIAAWWLAWRQNASAAMAVIFAGAIVGLVYVKVKAFPILDDRVSVRAFFRQHSTEITGACIDDGVRREWRYGLNYYAGREIQDCTPADRVRVGEQARRLVIH